MPDFPKHQMLYGNCQAFCPPQFRGRWRDWHRGKGCSLDDGLPRTAEGMAEIAALGFDHPDFHRCSRPECFVHDGETCAEGHPDPRDCPSYRG